MVVRKVKLGKKIEKDILRVLKKETKPVSTRDISLKIGRAWHAVQLHCLKLQLAKKINGYKISNLNVWVMR